MWFDRVSGCGLYGHVKWVGCKGAGKIVMVVVVVVRQWAQL